MTNEHSIALTFLWIAVILLAARFAELIERLGQPAVLGELLVGVTLGNLSLLGIQIFEPIESDPIILFLAELGVVLLLFQVGLESNIQEMRRVGLRASLVAVVGVALPFVLGTYIFGPWLLPGYTFATYLFLGATLTATSVAITAKVFRDLGRLPSPEARIILGAAVIDDVLGLVILSVVSAIVAFGVVSLGDVSWIVAKAVIFLLGAIAAGQLLASPIGRLMAAINGGVASMLTLAVSFGLVFAYLAEAIGLAPIVGAFAAGLALDPVHFRHFAEARIVKDVRESVADAPAAIKARVLGITRSYTERHIEHIIEPLIYFLAPIFFVVTGMSLRLETLFNLPMLLVALGVATAAIVGKIAAGLAAGNVNKWIVGLGMVPRGEVGLIFAAVGRSLGVVPDDVFSVIVVVVILTTFLTPPILALLLRRETTAPGAEAESPRDAGLT